MSYCIEPNRNLTYEVVTSKTAHLLAISKRAIMKGLFLKLFLF